jgi:hypothetical protein
MYTYHLEAESSTLSRGVSFLAPHYFSFAGQRKRGRCWGLMSGGKSAMTTLAIDETDLLAFLTTIENTT